MQDNRDQSLASVMINCGLRKKWGGGGGGRSGTNGDF